jgi:hypothetical protein
MANVRANDDVFVYMGGNQRVPHDVTHVRVHKSVKIITREAFRESEHLVSIEMHDGVEIIEDRAFSGCSSLTGIKLPGVRVIEKFAFHYCTALADVEFGNKLESIGDAAFRGCRLRNIKLPKVRIFGICAFAYCEQLTDVELSEYLETIGGTAFLFCLRLRRIIIPLKENLLENDYVFNCCENLSQVDLVGGIHKTISSLLLDSWRNEMKNEIDRINQVLPNTPATEKTRSIQQWITRVLQRMEHYKSEHQILVKEAMTLLELALWKAKLPNETDGWRIVGGLGWPSKKKCNINEVTKKATIDTEAARKEHRVTCGANIIIPHVLSFLNDDDIFPLLHYDHQP